jgi:hypothetical protein
MLTGRQKKKAIGKMKCHGEKGDVYKRDSQAFEKQNWAFKMYVTSHKKCYQALEEHSKLMPPSKQVQDLIDEIDCSNRIMAAFATLLSRNNPCEDFQASPVYSCNFIAANKSENTTRLFSGDGSGG